MLIRHDTRDVVLHGGHIAVHEAAALYAMNFLRTFALSLPGIFIPIYIFLLPDKPHLFAGDFANGFAWIALSSLITALTAALCNVLLLRTVFRTLRFKRSLLASMVILVGYLVSLIFMKQYFFLFFVAAVLSGMNAHFYWVPFHIFFVRKADAGGNFGEESALQLFMGAVAGVVGPLVAGILIEQFGFRVMFSVALFFVLCAAIPVLLWVGENEHRDHALAPIVRAYAASARKRRLALAFAGNGIEGMLYDMAWPLLLYVVLTDYIRLGAIVTFSIAFSSLLMLWFGRMIERRRHAWLQKGSFVLNALLYAVRLIPLTPLRAYAIDVVDRLNGKMYGVAFTTAVYDAAQEFGVSDLIIFREFTIHASQAAAAALVLVGLFLGFPWTFVFVFAMVAASLTLFVF